MRERINRLAKGILDTEVPVISIEPARVDEEIKAGERVRREIYLTSGNSLHVKGLVYSTNTRVKPVNSSFGGLRNRIGYEVDSSFLEYGDVIEGSFYLVTNGGEKEVPYSFRVEADNSGKILRQLKTARDFAVLARRDYDLALRLFEFRNFVNAPFMQDMQIRAVYDGLRGQGNRYGQLEQFFITLGVKEPVKISVNELKKQYASVDSIVTDEIEIRKEGWGHLPVTVTLEGNFLQSMKKVLTDEDFQDNCCRFLYEINSGAMHAGRNFGSIILETMYETIRICVEAEGPFLRTHDFQSHGRYSRYLALRLEFDGQREKSVDLIHQMEEELEQIRLSSGSTAELSLMQAEIMTLTGEFDRAGTYLEECRDRIYAERMEKPAMYCLYQYVFLKVQPNIEKKESLTRLLKKYIEEGSGEYLLFYLYLRCDEAYCFENPAEVLSRMKVLYAEGCRSPFLYQHALEMWNQMPELFFGIGPLEVQALNFGAKRKLVDRDLALKAAKLSLVSRYDQMLCLKVLKKLYESYPEKAVLEAICSLMIRNGCRRESDFQWYERALREDVSLTRLYEYYLYSLPKDYKQLIPKQVLLYFSYDHDLDRNSREVLYENIIRYLNEETSLYQEYEREISRFAVEQILESRINSRLAVIYDEMIYPDMVDASVARVMPSILKSYRISCSNPRMKYVVVCYEELTEEGIYPLQDGIAFVPIFSKDVVILFQDAYGNRYGQISHVKTRALDKPELEKRCFELERDHPMLLLGACREVSEKKEFTDEDCQIIEKALSKLPLHPLYRKLLTGQVIRCYGEKEKSYLKEKLPSFSVDAELLSREQRNGLCEVYIKGGYVKEAFDMMVQYRCVVSGDSLQKLCSAMILAQFFDHNDLLLQTALEVYQDKRADSVILDYLCEHFNGTCRQMYDILISAVAQRVETYDLEERLLAQMMFADEVTWIDKVFSLYVSRKKAGESIVKAYFTMKSAGYFLHDMAASDAVFSYLEEVVKSAIEKGRLSTVYLLALSKYYSGLETLSRERRILCQTIVDILLEEGMVFPYMKKLAGQISIPAEVMDKSMIQYSGQRDSRVELEIRILPQEEKFHRDEIRRVYQGIFVRQKVLFEGEIMEYRIYEQKQGQRVMMEEGSIACEMENPGAADSRFQLLNQMSFCLNAKEEEGLKTAMEEYVKKNAVVEALFQLW